MSTSKARPYVSVQSNVNLTPNIETLLQTSNATPADRSQLGASLMQIPDHLLEKLNTVHTRIVVIHAKETYAGASPVLRRLGYKGPDNWPWPPAGLFVVEERTLYLRSLSATTVGHEIGHALDAALGGGVYLSVLDSRIRSAFENATAFITPYSATGVDEFFAEASRAMYSLNDTESELWPHVSPQRLASIDPTMFAYMEDLFAP